MTYTFIGFPQLCEFFRSFSICYFHKNLNSVWWLLVQINVGYRSYIQSSPEHDRRMVPEWGRLTDERWLCIIFISVHKARVATGYQTWWEAIEMAMFFFFTAHWDCLWTRGVQTQPLAAAVLMSNARFTLYDLGRLRRKMGSCGENHPS